MRTKAQLKLPGTPGTLWIGNDTTSKCPFCGEHTRIGLGPKCRGCGCVRIELKDEDNITVEVRYIGGKP